MQTIEKCKAKGVFWQSISNQLAKDELSFFDLQTLQELTVCSKWIDMVPRGLVHSYTYMYHCVKGLGCEDGEIIEKDVLRTVGAVKDGSKVFGDISDLERAGTAQTMYRVLTAISITDSMGYCQGMNYVADYLLKFTSEEETFCLFLFALRSRHLCCLYETKLPILSDFMEVFELQLNVRLPLLASTLRARGFIAPFYSIEWFTTLFTLACPPDLTGMVLDLFFAGLQDVQIRCGIAIMEILEPQLLLMSVEELLKEFRTLCQGVQPEEVILRALRIQLVAVKLSHSAASIPQAFPFHKSTYIIDCKYEDDKYAETLLCLRLRYISEATTAMQERDADCGRWIKDRIKRRLSAPTLHAVESPYVARNSSEGMEVRLADNDDDGSIAVEVIVSEVLGSIVDELSMVEEGRTIGRVSLYLLSSRYRDTVVDPPDPAVHQEYFKFLTDPQLMSSANELKKTLVLCDRIAQWVQLNQKWVDCLGYFKSELAKYNMADHLLRYAIIRNSHLRTVLFLLAIAGADPNSQDRWLRTPLHYAASYNRPDVVRLLLLAGADPTVHGALRPPQLDYMPTTLTSAVQLVLQNSSPCMTVLKGKSCVSCNVLYHRSSLQKRSCSTCDISLCPACFDSHRCVWHHGSVAGAMARGIQPVCSTNQTGCDSSGISGASDDDASILSVSQLSSEPSLLAGDTPINSEIGVLRFSPDISAADEPMFDDTLIASKSDNGGLVESGFGDVREDCKRRLESLDFGAADVSSPHSVPMSRRHSTSLMSWFKSNYLSRSAKIISANAQGADLSGVSSEMSLEQPVSTSPTPSGELQLVSKISRKEMLSMALESGLKKLKGISRSKSSVGKSSRLRREGAGDDIPLYCLGYRDDESYLIRLQPWQALLLPLVFGAEENRSNMSMDDLRAPGSCRNIEVHVASAGDPAGTDSHEKCPTRVSICGICDVNIDECQCRKKLSLKKSTHLTAEPISLYLRQEMAFLYALLKRDADMLSEENAALTEANKWPDPMNEQDVMDSNNFGLSLAQHLMVSGDNVTGIFDNTYTSSPNSTTELSAQLTKEGSVGGVSATPTTIKSRCTAEDSTTVGGDCTQKRFITSQPSVEALRRRILRKFVHGGWTVGEVDEFWVPDDRVWYCKCCATQFSMFRRKHHCRRCGGVFCADDAPRVDMTDCLPYSFEESMKLLLSCDLNIDRKQFRLCASCKSDMRQCTELLTEIDTALPSYTLAFWLFTLSSQPPLNTLNGEGGDTYSADWKDLRLGRFPVAGQWIDSMADWLWREKV